MGFVTHISKLNHDSVTDDIKINIVCLGQDHSSTLERTESNETTYFQ